MASPRERQLSFSSAPDRRPAPLVVDVAVLCAVDEITRMWTEVSPRPR